MVSSLPVVIDIVPVVLRFLWLMCLAYLSIGAIIGGTLYLAFRREYSHARVFNVALRIAWGWPYFMALILLLVVRRR